MALAEPMGTMKARKDRLERLQAILKNNPNKTEDWVLATFQSETGLSDRKAREYMRILKLTNKA